MESDQLTLEGFGITVVGSDFKPTTGLRGVYSLREPFKSALSGAIHTCTAVQKITSLIANGENVYEKYYKPFALTEDDYDKDVLADKDIIQLTSDGGSILHFPVGYMEAFPDMNGVVYVSKYLTISLPPVPRDQNIDLLKENVLDLVKKHLGVVSGEIDHVEMGDLMLVSHDKDAVVQAERNAQMELLTPMAKAEEYRRLYEDMKLQRDQLLAYVDGLP